MLRSARFIISEKVRHALASNKGVVALESTVITHGLPYPQNLETAKALENEIEREDCEPATIALLEGKIHIGLTTGQLQEVADTLDSVKVSKRDIAYALNNKLVGGTTVAATMHLAYLAGVRVFATGGIGGVHRGAELTFDISADLLELAKTPITVVSAGVKSILDIPKTVEYLETHSVNTIVYGKENEFPGFFTRHSGCQGQFNTTDLEEVAAIIETSRELCLPAGTLLACPIPDEFQADGKFIENCIEHSLKLAHLKGIKAQEVTPFVLKTVNQLSKGESMKTNIALLKNNARIGAQLARILAADKYKSTPIKAPLPKTASSTSRNKPKVTVIGATIVDLETITQKDVEKDGGSYEGKILQRCGGVGRNHADALTRLGIDATLISAVGLDSYGRYVFDHYNHMDTSRIVQIENIPTATYCSVNVKGDIWYGISAIGRIVDEITPKMIERNQETIMNSEFLVLDGNIPVETIAKAVDVAKTFGIPVWFDPTDYHKACKFIDSGKADGVKYISPNVNEFKRIAERMGVVLLEEAFQSPQHLDDFLRINTKIMEQFHVLLISMAQKGTLVYKKDSAASDVTFLPPPINPRGIVSASGAGDCLNSGIIAGILRGLDWKNALELGLKAARCSLESTEAVPETLNTL